MGFVSMNKLSPKNGSIENSKIELMTICSRYSENQELLKKMAVSLFKKRKSYVQDILFIDVRLKSIDNLPDWCTSDIIDSLSRMDDFRLAIKYENSLKEFVEKTGELGNTYATIADVSGKKGTAIEKLGQSTAMAIATVMGTKSTGITVNTSSNAAATNAAFAKLGKDAIIGGGTGLVVGSAILGLLVPIGFLVPIKGLTIGLGTLSGIVAARKIKKEKKVKSVIDDIGYNNRNSNSLLSRLSEIITSRDNKRGKEEVESLIDDIEHDNENLQTLLSRLSELIARSDNNEQQRLKKTISWITEIQPQDYQKWDNAQKEELEQLINVVSNTVQLINERI